MNKKSKGLAGIENAWKSIVINIASGFLKVGIACVLLVTAFGAFATTQVIDKNTSWSRERASANQNEQDIQYYKIVVPAETRATVTIRRTSLYAECCGGGLRVNFGDGNSALMDDGAVVSRTLSTGTSTVRVEAYIGGVQRHRIIIGDTGYPSYQPLYQWVYYEYYSCEGRYDLEVEFEKLQPDLSMSSLSVSESGIVMDDADVTVSFTVANALLKSCGAFGVDLLIDGTKQSSFSVDGLSAGSSVRKSVPLGRLAAGRHAIVVKADVGNAVVESSESNNERSLTFKVY